jgi:hypothetical protein
VAPVPRWGEPTKQRTDLHRAAAEDSVGMTLKGEPVDKRSNLGPTVFNFEACFRYQSAKKVLLRGLSNRGRK